MSSDAADAAGESECPNDQGAVKVGFTLFCLKAPILLNIFMNHVLLFIYEADVCNVTDMWQPYTNLEGI